MPIVNDIVRHELEKDAQEMKKRISDSEVILQKASEQDIDKPRSQLQWVASYKKWESYDDIDELTANIESAKKDLRKLNERIKNLNSDTIKKKCSHQFVCGCSRDKQAERQIVAMSTTKKLDEMRSLKEMGNVFFAEKQYEKALALYEKSLIYFEYCFGGNVEEQRKANELRLSCLLNAGKQCVEIVNSN